MPTTKVAEMLKPHSFEQFRQLAGAVVYHLGIPLSGLQSVCNIFERLVNDAELTCPEHVDLWLTTLECLSEYVDDLIKIIDLAVFRKKVGEGNDGINEIPENWQPFDDEAWDRFYAELADDLMAYMAKIREIRSSLAVPEEWASVLVNQGHTMQDVTDKLLPAIDKYVTQIETCLHPESLDELL